MTRRNATAAALVAGLLVSPFAWAADSADEEKEMYSIADFSCKEVMILSGDDRDSVISFMHGYLAGEAKKAEINVVKLGRATDTFIDNCLDSPTEKALAVMRAAVGD